MHKENRGKPSIYSFTFPSSLCLHQLRKHSEGREAKVFSPELGTLDIRPVDSQHCKGLQTRVNRESQAVKAAFPSSLESQSACPSNKRDYQPLRQESHSECSSPQETVLQQPFPCGKERGRATSGDKPILTKFFCAPSSFQDGGLEGSCRYSSSSRLYVQDRPQRRILCCSHPPGTPEATLFSVPECNLPVQMPTLWPHISTSGLHKSAEAPGGFCEETGSTDMHLHRQHANPEFSKGGSSERCLFNDPPAGKSGVCCEHGKIYSFPFTGNGIPRCSNQLHTHELFPSREQGFEPSERMQKTSKFQDCLTVRPSTLNWQNDSSKGSCIPGSTPLQSTSTAEELLRLPESSSSPEGNSRCRGLDRPGMVGKQPTHGQHQACETPPPQHSDPVGCFRVGLGGCVQQDRDQGNLVPPGILPSHKLLGAACSHLCNQSFYQIPAQCSCPNTNGQYISYSLSKQDGGSQAGCARQTCSYPLGMVPRQENNPSSRAHSGSTECHSRCRVSSKTRCSRLEARFKSVQGFESEFRSFYSRPFCQQEQCSAGEVLQLPARSSSRTVRRSSSALEGGECLRLPPFQFDQQVSEEDKPRRSNNVDCLPGVASTGLVPPPSTVANKRSSIASNSQQPTVRPIGEQTSPDCQQLLAPSRMESLRDHLSSEGISTEATDILLSAQRRSTNAQYKSCWAKWCCWCRQQQVDNFRPAVSDLVHFLTELFEQGKQYSTINTYRSAISSTVPPLDRTPLGQHKIVCSFMKGVFNKRPPKPRYSGTWEVSLVTGLFEKWPVNSNLDLKRLSRKCAMLLALTSAKRQSDLHALDLAFMQFLPEGVEFRIPGLTKTRAPGKDVVFFFPALKNNGQLCPVTCLREYIKRTAKLRNHNGVSQPLFLATQKPYSPVTSTSIGRWLKLTLQDAGIDTSVFKAHSTRGASSSAARQSGVSVKDILTAADWSRETTFNLYYYRPRHSASFGTAVIS